MPIPALIPLAMTAAKTIGAKLAAKAAAKAATSAVAKNVGANAISSGITTAAKSQINPAAASKRAADIAKAVGNPSLDINKPVGQDAIDSAVTDTTAGAKALDKLGSTISSISPLMAAGRSAGQGMIDNKKEVAGSMIKYGSTFGVPGAVYGYFKGKNDKAKRVAAAEQTALKEADRYDSLKAANQINRDAQMMQAATANIQPPTPSFTQGGNVTNRAKAIAMYREGGTLHMQNVIVDGPSHEEENETGIAGDKGIPVVKDGVKIAEIESKELVLNENASDELVAMYKEYQKHPSEALLNKIAALMDYELKHNTYDYTKELLA